MEPVHSILGHPLYVDDNKIPMRTSKIKVGNRHPFGKPNERKVREERHSSGG
jgi:hypothetical protein